MATSPKAVIAMETVQEYFSQLNPIANKIAQDIQQTKAAYGQLWTSLRTSDHIDIINETLIKPEISLHYFDKFSPYLISRPSSKISSYGGSIDSLNAISIKQLATNKDLEKTETLSSEDMSNSALKQSYDFDRRNLSTFATHKIALKIVNDDTLVAFRDEHSKPFSYKTRSQLNLNIFKEEEYTDGQMCMLVESHDSKKSFNRVNVELKQMLSKYKKFQNKICQHIDHKIENDCLATNSSVYERFYESHVKNVAQNKNNNPNKNSMNSNLVLTSTDVTSVESDVNFTPIFNSADYTEPYFVHEENINLMSNFRTGLLTAASSSTATSDDDQDDHKTLYEEVKLLDNDISIKNGFDFLNNW